MDDSPKPPKDRMSMSKNMVLRSKTAIILFFGSGKQDALKRFLEDDLSPREFPAKLVDSISNTYLLTDQEFD